MRKLTFPKDFLWGAATSAHQVEGNNAYSDWWHYEQKNNFIKSGETSGTACDHYCRYKEDFAYLKKLNLNSYRFSIEWARIEKEKGVYDQGEIAHYKEMLRELKRLDTTVFLTLNHFTIPNWLAEEGGWENKDSVEYFRKYTELIVREMGKLVDFWITLNEPYIPYAVTSFLVGLWPPLKINPGAFLKALKHLAEAHKASYDEIHKAIPGAKVSVTTSNAGYVPIFYFDVLLAPLANYVRNYFFLERVKNKIDFVGLNYYFPVSKWISNDKTDMGWPIYPKGIYEASLSLWRRYRKPIYITENGIADAKDKKRERFIKEHLIWLHKAVEDGVPVKAYLYWSLLDNLELSEGFWPRFGLLEVNYETQERTTRKSALAYAKIAKKGSLTTED